MGLLVPFPNAGDQETENDENNLFILFQNICTPKKHFWIYNLTFHYGRFYGPKLN
jgi:hypothetical protein